MSEASSPIVKVAVAVVGVNGTTTVAVVAVVTN